MNESKNNDLDEDNHWMDVADRLINEYKDDDEDAGIGFSPEELADYLLSTYVGNVFTNELMDSIFYDVYTWNNEVEFNNVLEQTFEETSDSLVKGDFNLNIASREFGSLLPNIQKNFPMCVVCHGDFEEKCMVSELNCNHMYHTDCIKEWSCYKQECPMCRATINR